MPSQNGLMLDSPDVKIALKIEDAQCPWNVGGIMLEIRDGVLNLTKIPEEEAQAGALIAQAIQEGAIFAGRTEAKVVSKSVKAGDVATSKTYATGVDVDPISAEEQQALMLISSYRVAPSPIQQLPVIRG